MNSKQKKAAVWASSLISSLTLFAGCGDPGGPRRAAAMGLVTFNGEPIKNGTIRFVTDTPQSLTKTTEIVDGQFSLTAELGPVVGTNRVEIQANGPGAFDDEILMAQLEAAGANKRRTYRKKFDVPVIPAKYNRQSELRATVVKGEANSFRFDLTSK